MAGAVATSLKNKGSPKAFHHAMAIPTAFYVLAWVFPVYINTFKKGIMDDHRNTELNIDQARTVNVKEIELERNASEAVVHDTSKGGHETIEKA